MLLQAFRVANEDVERFHSWGVSHGMESIATMYGENGTAVVLFRTHLTLSDSDVAQSALRVRRLALPRFNIEVDDLATLESIQSGSNPFWIGSETINDYIADVLRHSFPVTVRTTRDDKTYVIFPDQLRGWKYAPV